LRGRLRGDAAYRNLYRHELWLIEQARESAAAEPALVPAALPPGAPIG